MQIIMQQRIFLHLGVYSPQALYNFIYYYVKIITMCESKEYEQYLQYELQRDLK